jgi:hypothetical protein
VKLKGIKQSGFSFFLETAPAYFCVAKLKNIAFCQRLTLSSFPALPFARLHLPAEKFSKQKV